MQAIKKQIDTDEAFIPVSVLWSPQVEPMAVKALSDSLEMTQREANA
jgi:hypothetical protein